MRRSGPHPGHAEPAGFACAGALWLGTDQLFVGLDAFHRNRRGHLRGHRLHRRPDRERLASLVPRELARAEPLRPHLRRAGDHDPLALLERSPVLVGLAALGPRAGLERTHVDGAHLALERAHAQAPRELEPARFQLLLVAVPAARATPPYSSGRGAEPFGGCAPAGSPCAVGASGSAAPPFRWPARGAVTSAFGMRGKELHEGIDISHRSGMAVRAAAPGTVVFSDRRPGYGRAIILKHADGYQTFYAHNQDNLVMQGARVEQGQLIADMGSTGESTGPHLHFEIRIGDRPVDPLRCLPARD
jgi:hypothetical protein